jgi:hypothetical protein
MECGLATACQGVEPELTEPFTTTPVTTGAVIVLRMVKNFRSSVNLGIRDVDNIFVFDRKTLGKK